MVVLIDSTDKDVDTKFGFVWGMPDTFPVVSGRGVGKLGMERKGNKEGEREYVGDETYTVLRAREWLILVFHFCRKVFKKYSMEM